MGIFSLYYLATGAIGFFVFGQFVDVNIKEALPDDALGCVNLYAFIYVSLARFFLLHVSEQNLHIHYLH